MQSLPACVIKLAKTRACRAYIYQVVFSPHFILRLDFLKIYLLMHFFNQSSRLTK